MLTNVSQATMESVFAMENGYVLSFKSRKQFQSFVAECTGIDVETKNGYVSQNSMAKKLRYFVEHENDTAVSKLLLALLNMREQMNAHRLEDDPDFQDPHAAAACNIKTEVEKMAKGYKTYSTNDERLNADMQSAMSILKDIRFVLNKLVCNQAYTYKSKENELNDYIRDMLKSKGYNETHDQTRYGVSTTKIDAGEIDILLAKNGIDIAIIECLKLDCINKDVLNTHIQKTIINYNPSGVPTFIIIYVGAIKYDEFCNKLYTYLSKYDYGLNVNTPFHDEVQENAAIKISSLILENNGFAFPVFFLAVKV